MCVMSFGGLRELSIASPENMISHWVFPWEPRTLMAATQYKHECMHDSVSELKYVCQIIWGAARDFYCIPSEQDKSLSISLRTSNPDGNNTIQARVYAWFCFRTKIRVSDHHINWPTTFLTRSSLVYANNVVLSCGQGNLLTSRTDLWCQTFSTMK